MTGGGKPDAPKAPAPAPQAVPTTADLDSPEARRRRKGHESTILASRMNQRNNTSILKVDTLG
jgi:hypothetical protein